MKMMVKRLHGTAREFKITLPPERVNEAIEEAVRSIQKGAEFPGFRKGNVPGDLVRKKYAREVLEEAKKSLIPPAYEEALEEHGAAPVSFPDIADVAIDEKGGMEFTARVDMQPEFKLAKYKGITVASEKVSVTDKEVEDVLESIRAVHASFVPIEGVVRKGDFAVVSLEAFMEGKSLGIDRKNAWIEAKKESSLLGLGEDLVGMKRGEEKKIEVALPDDYPDKNYAGRKAEFRVVIKDICERKLPPLDDELAKKLGKKDPEELRADVMAGILERKELDNRIRMKDQIREKLLLEHSFDLPLSMVKRQHRALVERVRLEMRERGVGEKEISDNEEKIRKDLLPEAERKVKLYFILDVIAREEKITVTTGDMEERLKGIAASFNRPFEEVKKYYENKDLIGGLAEQIREDKTLDLLLREAKTEQK